MADRLCEFRPLLDSQAVRPADLRRKRANAQVVGMDFLGISSAPASIEVTKRAAAVPQVRAGPCRPAGRTGRAGRTDRTEPHGLRCEKWEGKPMLACGVRVCACVRPSVRLRARMRASALRLER